MAGAISARTSSPAGLRPHPTLAVVNGLNVRSLTVVAGPTAVGKTWLLRLLATDDRLRDRLGMPKTVAAVAPREFLKLKPSSPTDELIVH